MNELEEIKKKYYDAIRGREGRWLDPGEYEDIIKNFFEKDVPRLIALAEQDDTQLEEDRGT